jgi:hypothetical protein
MLNNGRPGSGGLVPSMYADTNFDTKDSYLINSPVRNQIVPDHQRRGSAGPYGIPIKIAARSDYDDDLGISDDEIDEYDTEYEDPEDKPRKAQKTKGPGFLADLVGNVSKGLAPASKMRSRAMRPEAPLPRRRATASRSSVDYAPPRRPRSRAAQEPYPSQRRRRSERYAPMRRAKLSSLNSVVLNSYPNLGIYKYANPQQQSGFGLKPQPGMLTGGSPGLKNPVSQMSGPVTNYLSNVNTPPAQSGTPKTNFTSSAPPQQARTPAPSGGLTFMPPNIGKQMFSGMMGHYNENGLTNARNAMGHAAEKYNITPLNFMPGVEFKNLGPLNSLQVNPIASMTTGAQNYQNLRNVDQSHNFQNPYSVAPNENYTGVNISGTF